MTRPPLSVGAVHVSDAVLSPTELFVMTGAVGWLEGLSRSVTDTPLPAAVTTVIR